MSQREYRAVSNAIAEAEMIRLFLKKQKERDAMTLLIGLANDKLQAIVEADREKYRQSQLRRYDKTKMAAVYGKATQTTGEEATHERTGCYKYTRGHRNA